MACIAFLVLLFIEQNSFSSIRIRRNGQKEMKKLMSEKVRIALNDEEGNKKERNHFLTTFIQASYPLYPWTELVFLLLSSSS